MSVFTRSSLRLVGSLWNLRMLPRAFLALVICFGMCEVMKLDLVIVRPSSCTGWSGCLYF